MILTTAIKENMKYLLKEIWDVDSDDHFCKIFARETKNGVIKFSRHSKAEFQKLYYR